MKFIFASFVVIFLTSNLASAITYETVDAIASGLSDKIDAIEECSIATEDGLTEIRGTQVKTLIVCYMGMGTKYDDDRYYSVVGMLNGKGKNLIFTPSEIKKIEKLSEH